MLSWKDARQVAKITSVVIAVTYAGRLHASDPERSEGSLADFCAITRVKGLTSSFDSCINIPNFRVKATYDPDDQAPQKR